MESASKQYTLGKHERLKSREQIEQLLREGKSFAIAPFRIYYMLNSEESIANRGYRLQFGVGVSNKNFKRAVDRNRIKRLAREAWRLQNSELKDGLKEAGKQLNVFFIYTGKAIPDYKLVSEKVKAAIQKLIKTIEQKR